MTLLNPQPARERAAQIQRLQMEAQRMVDYSRRNGLVLTISLESRQPLAMGSYDMCIDIREARNGAV